MKNEESRFAQLSHKIDLFFAERDPNVDEKPGDILDMFDVTAINGTKVILRRLLNDKDYLAVIESPPIARLIRTDDTFLITLRQKAGVWIAWHMSPPYENGEDVEDSPIDCETHGPSLPHYVCRHLLQLSGQGYCVPEDDIENADQAWCFHCESVLEEEKGWTQAALDFAGFSLVCRICFLKILESNKFFAVPDESIN